MDFYFYCFNESYSIIIGFVYVLASISSMRRKEEKRNHVKQPTLHVLSATAWPIWSTRARQVVLNHQRSSGQKNREDRTCSRNALSFPPSFQPSGSWVWLWSVEYNNGGGVTQKTRPKKLATPLSMDNLHFSQTENS